MLRFRLLVLLCAALTAAVQARDCRAEAAEGPYVEGDEYHHPRPGERPLFGWNPYYYPELYQPQPEPSIPPGTPYNQAWMFNNQWQYPSYPTGVSSGGVIYPSSAGIQTSPIVSPATPIATNVAANVLPYNGPGVTIRLEEQVGGSVNYLIDGREEATIQAGQQQALTTKGTFEIRFSRGSAPDGQSYGEARYSLGEGSYFFTVTERGWDLLRDPSQPTVAAPQVKPASPSGLTTTPLPPKVGPQPGTAAAVPAQPTQPATAVPAANTVPSAPAAPSTGGL